MSASMACCLKDDEPLVETFVFPGYEFICMVCKTKYPYFGPKGREVTPELEARQAELTEQYRAWRAQQHV